MDGDDGKQTRTDSGGRGPDTSRFCVHTRTRVDVGSWVCKRRVTARVLGNRLLLLAPGRRPLVENIPFDRLRETLYNHVTGEVVLGPAEAIKVTRLRMSPLEAAELLRHVKGTAPEN